MFLFFFSALRYKFQFFFGWPVVDILSNRQAHIIEKKPCHNCSECQKVETRRLGSKWSENQSDFEHREEAASSSSHHIIENEDAGNDGINIRCEKGKIEHRSARQEEHVWRKRIHGKQAETKCHQQTHCVTGL